MLKGTRSSQGHLGLSKPHYLKPNQLDSCLMNIILQSNEIECLSFMIIYLGHLGLSRKITCIMHSYDIRMRMCSGVSTYLYTLYIYAGAVEGYKSVHSYIRKLDYWRVKEKAHTYC